MKDLFAFFTARETPKGGTSLQLLLAYHGKVLVAQYAQRNLYLPGWSSVDLVRTDPSLQIPSFTLSSGKAFQMSSAYDVLVTGSAGHLGTALMLCLPSMGFKPFGIDILSSPTTTAVGSVCDRAFIASVFRNHPIKHVLHAATLHKPHVCSHTKEDFISTNIAGTLILLEESSKVKDRIESFVFFSTTSAFGMALNPKPGFPAAWIDESVVPEPKNIYGVTKVAAEDMCALVQRESGMPVLVLRTSRFFPEEDDDEDRRAAMSDENLKVLELAYRRCDIEDIGCERARVESEIYIWENAGEAGAW
ncbi:conserved hypothetical protein [Aspergillus terreus NIH2624]|uniref:NAD-dependent epimerase/dehydratase domain-containing protein n=1 Tax=Aspergillus terreus (strain NIH 2624 / FGSC A1156) TaxID=341663 RepID=Q0CIP8_ASPTN|nr:uncharacterized protein ATEG_06436 [Aspergillus terreus NIH2624]EAU32980.1 conserved hypothetical protein [Aspergillus terreus NIH2624]